MDSGQNSTETAEQAGSGNEAVENDNVLNEEIEKLKKELEKAKSDYLYLRADFDNYRKQVIKERSEQSKYGAERFIRELLGSMDNFERARLTEVTPETIDNYRQGIDLTAKELNSLLEKFGVAEIETEGQPFDPRVHEAIGSEESEEVPAGHVLRVFKKGYKLHDKIIRPAQVVVAKAASPQNSEENGSQQD